MCMYIYIYIYIHILQGARGAPADAAPGPAADAAPEARCYLSCI